MYRDRLRRLVGRGLDPGERAQVVMNGALRHGDRPRGLAGVRTQDALDCRDPATLVLAYYADVDRGDVAMARRALQRALEHVEMGAPIRATLEAEAASFEARFRNDAGTARAFLDRALARGAAGELVAARAEALVLAAEGRDDTEPPARALELISEIEPGGMRAFEGTWLSSTP